MATMEITAITVRAATRIKLRFVTSPAPEGLELGDVCYAAPTCTTYWADVDGDGFGVEIDRFTGASLAVEFCGVPDPGYVLPGVVDLCPTAPSSSNSGCPLD